MLAFHAAGHEVIGFDISEQRLDVIRGERADLLATDRERLAGALADSQRFVLTSDLAALRHAATVLICVPTPIDHHLLPDLQPLRGACGTVAANVVPGQTIIATSTTTSDAPGDARRPADRAGIEVGRDVFVAFSPERIDPGNVGHAHEAVPRVVGGATGWCVERASEALSGYAERLHQVTTLEAAELTKLYENTFRAVNISLANEFADISRALGLDIAEVIDAAATKPYGFMPFYPGPGIGGHCIPCDPHYLLWQLRSRRVVAPLIENAMVSVATRPGQVVRRAVELLGTIGRPVAGASVLVAGIAYKPGIADVRESPALEIMTGLREVGARVSYTDPLVPAITLGGEPLLSIGDPSRCQWDLVLVHTVHPDVDLAWLNAQSLVLDTTYRLSAVPHRWTL
jgi:nucleotide sugar dehydrogenase